MQIDPAEEQTPRQRISIFSESQQFTIFNALPAAIARRYAFVAGEASTNRYGQAFVQEDSHAYDFDNKANSDRSKIRQTMSRVTEGKQVRNSWSV
jgi:hypothetical protein